MPDNQALAMMFNHGMNGLAAQQMGRQLVTGQSQDEANLQSTQLANQNAAVMNPLNQQFRQGQIDQQAAELPGIQAKSDYDTDTVASKIATTLAQNSAAIGDAGIHQMRQEAEKLGQVNAVLSQFDPSVHKELLPKIMQQYGLNTDTPMAQALINTPPQYVQSMVGGLAKGMAEGTQAYYANTGQQAQAQTFKAAEDDKHYTNQKEIAAGNNAATIRAAEIQAESRKAVAQARAQAMSEILGTDKAIARLEMKGHSRTPEEEDTLESLKRQRLQERAAGANAVAPNVLGQKNPLEAAAEAAKPRPREGSVDQLQNESQIAALAQKQGYAYEPAKYDYKIIGGVLHRKPK